MSAKYLYTSHKGGEPLYPTPDEAREVNKFLQHKHEIDKRPVEPKEMKPFESNKVLLETMKYYLDGLSMLTEKADNLYKKFLNDPTDKSAYDKYVALSEYYTNIFDKKYALALDILEKNLSPNDFAKIIDESVRLGDKFHDAIEEMNKILSQKSDAENVAAAVINAAVLNEEFRTALPTTKIKLDNAATAPAPTNLPLTDNAKTATTARTHQKILDQLSKIITVPYQGFKDNLDKMAEIHPPEQNLILNNETVALTTESVETFDKEKSSQIIEQDLEKIIDNNITIETTEISPLIKKSLIKSSKILTEKSASSELQSEKQTIKIRNLIEKVTTDAKASKEVASKSSKGLRHIAASFALIGLLLLAGKNFIPEEFKKEPDKPEKKKGSTEQFESGGPVQTTQPDLPEYVTPAEKIPAITLETPTPIIQPAAEPLLQPDTVAFNPNDYPYNPKAREIPVAGSSESEEFKEAMKKQASPPGPELKQPTSQPITNEGANLLPKK